MPVKMKYFKRCLLFVLLIIIFLFWFFKIPVRTENQMQANFENISSCKLVNEDSEKNIFFVETSGVLKNFTHTPATLTIRQACSVESAAVTNPNSYVFVVFVSKQRLGDSNAMQRLKKLQNIIFLQMNLVEFTKDTPVDKWMKTGKIYKTKFLRENISNLMKVLLLWR